MINSNNGANAGANQESDSRPNAQLNM